MTNDRSARALALDWIGEILEENKLSHLVIRKGLEAHPELDKRDRAFAARLVEGTVERRIELDYVIDRYASVKLKKMKPFIRTLLRMSVYQLLYMDSVPDSAVCNEAVKLAAKRGFTGLKGFVNGILRRIAAEKGSIPYPARDTAEGLSVRCSMPLWIVEEWRSRYGWEQTEQMLQAVLKERPLMVHVNGSRGTSPTEIGESLRRQGVSVTGHPYSRDAWILEQVDRLDDLDAFKKGEIQPQDISSQLASRLAVHALQLAAAQGGAARENGMAGSGMTGESPAVIQVLDVCAAPGGKSLYVADAAASQGIAACVTARDLTAAKTAMIEENRIRMGLTNLKTEVFDALVFDETKKNRIDVLIADLPCSGLGIMGRKNDIKYRITPEAQDELAKLQREILDIAAEYVKPGGYLIYSTCTVNPAENEENYRYLCGKEGWRAEDLSGWLPEAVAARSEQMAGGSTVKEGYLQLLPGVYDSDGFFVSVARKAAFRSACMP